MSSDTTIYVFVDVSLQIQLYQLSRLLHDHHPDLYCHLEEHEIAPVHYSAAWFLTMFASEFPLAFVSRVFGKFAESMAAIVYKCMFLYSEVSIIGKKWIRVWVLSIENLALLKIDSRMIMIIKMKAKPHSITKHLPYTVCNPINRR